MTDFERRVEIATGALCSPTSPPQTRRKMRRYARRVVRALDEMDAAESRREPPLYAEGFDLLNATFPAP